MSYYHGELTVENLIEKIQEKNNKIEIIIILENKKEELEEFLHKRKIYNILYHHKTEIKDVIYLLNSLIIKKEEKTTFDNSEELKKEINYLKNIILENQKKSEKNLKNRKIKNSIKKAFKKMQEKIFLKNKNLIKNIKKEEKTANIISITGPSGSGKSIISINLAKAMTKKNKKILIIDFDVLNNSLHTILGVKKYSKKIKENIEKNKKNYFYESNINETINIKDMRIKINKYIDLISSINLIFDSHKNINVMQLEKIINELKNIYSTIIIDTSSECFFDFTKLIIKLSNQTIFVTESNISELKKASNLLKIYINEWKIPKEKINILFNKYNKNSIDTNLLKDLFCEFNIIGTLKYNASYEKLINKNIKNNFLDKKIIKEYENVEEKINNKIYNKKFKLNN